MKQWNNWILIVSHVRSMIGMPATHPYARASDRKYDTTSHIPYAQSVVSRSQGVEVGVG